MKYPRFLFCLVTVAALFCGAFAAVQAAPAGADKSKQIPELLKNWESWATWGDTTRDCPRPYMDAKKPLCLWPSKLALNVDKTSGRFAFGVTVYAETWVPLPGGDALWPQEVKANGAPVPVVEHQGRASVLLAAGTWAIEGSFHWNEIPQRITLPKEIGILSLTLDGKPVAAPIWDANGLLWLKRDGSTEETDKDFLSVKIHALVEDGIPLWMRTQVELIVSGKSREEELGDILPAGWRLSAVESPIPVAVDDAGRVKAQVRAGKWTLNVTAFRIDNPTEFRFAPGAKPAVKEELIAFRSNPDFRMVDIVGPPSIDVSQTTFPDQWREFPVYRWDTATPFGIKERMRGMGLQKPAGLTISREWWMDDDGRGFTFRDTIYGGMQQIWRLDAAEGQDLGSVRSGKKAQGQLITRNPQTGASGVEIRTRNLDLEATGRMQREKKMSAAGWRSDADSLDVTLNLPPGWRLFALFGADHVKGDWLTAWTLLDLFLLLLFSLAVGRLWGPVAGVVAFLAFGLSFQEPHAPRAVWLLLLMPVALLRFVKEGWGHRILVAWKWLTVTILLLILVPFLAGQVQKVLYPQLETTVGDTWFGFVRMSNAACPADFSGGGEDGEAEPAALPPPPPMSADAVTGGSGPSFKAFSSRAAQKSENLKYDAKARIQTGPGVPDRKWRSVSFGWNGPVTAEQQVRPILISLTLERIVTVVRIALLMLLAGILLDVRRWGVPLFRAGGKTALLLAVCCLGFASPVQAQIPDKELLNTLRDRLTEPSDAYPNAADIPSVSLALDGRKIVMEAEIHAAIRTAVALPGRLAAWSPVMVLVDGKPEAALRRADGYLWVALTEGVHQVRVEGLLAEVTEWEWTFQLKPHRVRIEAPGWTFSGVRPDGTPEQQVFFALKQKSTAGAASYDRQDYQSVAAVERRIELGLVWHVRTTVTRLSAEGKAIALRIPLLPGENVLTSNAILRDGAIEVRLGAHQQSFTWESELGVTPEIKIGSKADDAWVERWSLVVSPVWNIAFSGLKPIFEQNTPELIPVWHPWPGEGVELKISRPEAIPGATVTISNGTHSITLGKRQRTSKLNLSVRTSLAEDFLIDLPEDAEITALQLNGKGIPVRQDGSKLIVPLRAGEQTILVDWKSNLPLAFRATAGAVRLPVESANIQTSIRVPDDRWTLWAYGPQRGPAVRFWGVLICSLLAAWVLGRTALSPLSTVEWMLLLIGLTQIPLPAALIVIGWLFFLAWRGRPEFLKLSRLMFNLLQVDLILLTPFAFGVLIAVVATGLLGNPDMFVLGNDSTRSTLNWYQARCGTHLPEPGCFTVSIWWYRFLMLAWALWLASALIRWLRWGWTQFSSGGYFRKKQPATPPTLPS